MPTPSNRLLSLDVFRGATIVAMIMVNNPGSWDAIYPPLRHAEWHGWTPTDLVFPFFLFIVGVAVVFAFAKPLAAGADKRPLLLKALRRGAVLVALGIFQNAFPVVEFYPEFGIRPDIPDLRLMGVLQRIGICYVAVVAIYLYVKPRWHAWIFWGALLGYWFLMTAVPVPGYGPGSLDDPVNNLSSWFDRLILGTHLWVKTNHTWDPESLLGCIPATATTMLGLWAGKVLKSGREAADKVVLLLVAGFAFTALGWAWSGLFPINKALWTSSYVAFTGGLALSLLGICYWVCDVRKIQGWTYPFVVYGVNAITVYVMSFVVARLMRLVWLEGPDGSMIQLKPWIFVHAFDSWLPTTFASLVFSLVWVGGWYLVLDAMYKRGKIVKV